MHFLLSSDLNDSLLPFEYKRALRLGLLAHSTAIQSIMRTFVLFLGLLGFALATLEVILEDEDGSQYEVNAGDNINEKAAPWWEQQEELAKRRCQSSCTMHSKGVKEPQITLCDDTNVCPLNRQSVNDYASSQCQSWSSTLNGLVLGEGRQVKHQPVKGNWLACAVFCKTSSGGQWYAPKKELEALNIDPYFPDGVWCHTDHETETNYYCQNHLCMAEQKP